MNRALPEMLHCLDTPGNIAGDGTDVPRTLALLKWQQEQFQQPPSCFIGNELSMFSIPAQAQECPGLISNDPGPGQLVTRVVKSDASTENEWTHIGNLGGDDHLSAFEVADDTKRTESVSPENLISAVGRERFNKRKADKTHSLKVLVAEEDTKEKRIKGLNEEGDSKITYQSSSIKNTTTNNHNNNRETSTDTSKETSKASVVQKPDYIHVRARRGQATDSHSLAERVRREKIGERMKCLQGLVPGCNKITGKAGMLDEIINYVQSLQRQVEFLSMKLAAVNPRLDFNIDNFFTKEMFPGSTSNFQSLEMVNPTNFQLNPLQQVLSCCGLEMGINPETFPDSSYFNQIQLPPTWDAELQNLYGVDFQQRR